MPERVIDIVKPGNARIIAEYTVMGTRAQEIKPAELAEPKIAKDAERLVEIQRLDALRIESAMKPVKRWNRPEDRKGAAQEDAWAGVVTIFVRGVRYTLDESSRTSRRIPNLSVLNIDLNRESIPWAWKLLYHAEDLAWQGKDKR
ncbi:hypothetical protein [Candidatus Nitronereus thalassa]|uniref:Uncharacterized protein n=1 Tax=Candidatus Nitronereus thalassa TaxID=3020898 RepID=A0ABU3K394_9BACT|nr:hypothetical protein [Candidatus Nitronereus thalassa]MDT7040846.1 hypothetical protein [Candidatus Nitronereus thalassa]